MPKGMIMCSGAITVEELLLCLKRIKKSITFWTQQLGRKGYMQFVVPQLASNAYLLQEAGKLMPHQ